MLYGKKTKSKSKENKHTHNLAKGLLEKMFIDQEIQTND